jgi:alpha-tubulin suppressor-like RCC1 family protein
MCGLNDYWRLAQGHKNNIGVFTEIKTRWMSDLKFSECKFGAAHVIGLTEDGRVYTWGK